MSTATASSLVEQARDAAGRGVWQQAYALFIEADASAPLAGADLATFAEVAYAAGHLDVTIDSWERAYAQNLSGDFAGARQWAQRAIGVGAKCDPAAAAVGRVAEARSVILAGDVAQGLDLLNEAAVAAVSGELEPLMKGVVYCEVVCAFQALAQYDQAEEWTAAMERWCRGQAVGSIHGRCRVHRAEILRLRGCCAEAESEALLACDELRPYLRRELGWPLTELGRIRLRRGNVDGAEASFREAHEVGWDPQPGLALVHLANGDAASAAASVRDALENPPNVPSKELPPNTELRRAPLLEAQVEIGVTSGELQMARTAAEELSRVAARFESTALVATAALAHGRVSLAEGELALARRYFEEAVQLWNDIGAPYETALARMGLGHAHSAASNEELAVVEFRAARAAFERIGAVHRAAAADEACGDAHGGDAAPALEQRPPPGSNLGVRTACDDIFRREGEYWCVAFETRTIRLRDSKGLRYLARLLAHPGRDFHVLGLVTGDSGSADDGITTETGLTISTGWDAGVLLDAQAKSAYRRRLAEVEEDAEAARDTGNHKRAAQADAERDFLMRELARAVGLGGRERYAASTSERARASVTRAVRQAMARIGEHHPALGKHLERTVRTGTYCGYLPDPRAAAAWKV